MIEIAGGIVLGLVVLIVFGRLIGALVVVALSFAPLVGLFYLIDLVQDYLPHNW